MAAINAALIDTIAACGDVNRNVLAAPIRSSRAPTPRCTSGRSSLSSTCCRAPAPTTRSGSTARRSRDRGGEPIYGATYLPRKFKAAIAVPPYNDVDVFAHDLGFIAIAEDGELAGFNLIVGGGMGATHGDPTTYPRLADMLGFLEPEQVLAVAEAVRHHPARLRRPRGPQARPAQVHHR